MNFKLINPSGLWFLPVLIIVFISTSLRAQDSTLQMDPVHHFTINPSEEMKGDSDSWFADDKYRHLVGGLFSTTLLIKLSNRGTGWNKKESKIFAAGTTISLSIVKELYDGHKPENHFCWKDLTAGAAGIILGLILTGIR